MPRARVPTLASWRTNQFIIVFLGVVSGIYGIGYGINCFIARGRDHEGSNQKIFDIILGIIAIFAGLVSFVAVVDAWRGKLKKVTQLGLMISGLIAGTAIAIVNVIRRYVCKSDIINQCANIRGEDRNIAPARFLEGCTARWTDQNVWTYVGSVVILLYTIILVHTYWTWTRVPRSSIPTPAPQQQSYQMGVFPNPYANNPPPPHGAYPQGSFAAPFYPPAPPYPPGGDAVPPYDPTRAVPVEEKKESDLGGNTWMNYAPPGSPPRPSSSHGHLPPATPSPETPHPAERRRSSDEGQRLVRHGVV